MCCSGVGLGAEPYLAALRVSTENPRRGVLENWASGLGNSRKPDRPILCSVVHEYSAHVTNGNKLK
jgi:hypothetical protein